MIVIMQASSSEHSRPCLLPVRAAERLRPREQHTSRQPSRGVLMLEQGDANRQSRDSARARRQQNSGLPWIRVEQRGSPDNVSPSFGLGTTNAWLVTMSRRVLPNNGRDSMVRRFDTTSEALLCAESFSNKHLSPPSGSHLVLASSVGYNFKARSLLPQEPVSCPSDFPPTLRATTMDVRRDEFEGR
jgi:hypothetical protein